MATPFPTDAWIKALQDRLNSSAAYAAVARNWEGDLLFEIREVAPGAPPVQLYMDLWHGRCRNAYQVGDGEARPAAFRLSASLANFVRVLRGELDPMQAMVTGKIKVHGSMITMMRNIPTVLEFVRTAQAVETDFPVA